MTNNKTLANRRNALLSTGPQTPAGRAKVSKNALAHGLYAATIVPALGETPTALAELCAAVRQGLCPEGVIEERLCDRVALLFLRLGRVVRFEAATANGAAAAVASPRPRLDHRGRDRHLRATTPGDPADLPVGVRASSARGLGAGVDRIPGRGYGALA